MEYLKTYEIFGLFKKRSGLDPGLIEDLIDSDMDGHVFKCYPYCSDGININSSEYKLTEIYFKSDIKGRPVLKSAIWGSHDLLDTPDINYRYAIKSDFQPKKKGLTLDVNNITDAHDIKDDRGTRSMTTSFMLAKFMYDNINKDRLKEYGIGCCIFYDAWPSKILFYTL